MTSTCFVMALLVSFVCITVVAAAPVINSTAHSPFDSTENASTNVSNNRESDYLQWSNSTIAVNAVHVPVTVNSSTTFPNKPNVLNATANNSAALLDKPSIFNATGNGWETTADIITVTEFNTYRPVANSSLITVAPNLESKPVEMGATTNITNSTFNNSIFATHEQRTNSTASDDDLAIANSGNFTLNSVGNINSTIVQPQSNLTVLNSTINYSIDTAQHLNLTNNSSINSVLFSAHSELKPEVSNSTGTNTSTGSTVAEEDVRLQLGSKEISTSDKVSAISKRSIFTDILKLIPVIRIPVIRVPIIRIPVIT
ncbi:Hypothetical protein CINCED_3A019579 [Cinara cedri]|uniref:Uncharacterized protein n=1 Tax=Cinara cedri TaxID=506608 RepID=A0A5E4NBY1_9HEMI|nr:Hypothetical protein CINCED_3A019579 [Cinara cedri]